MLQELVGGLGAVVVVGGAEAEDFGGVEVVEIVDGADLLEGAEREQVGGQGVAQADSFLQFCDETAAVENVLGLSGGVDRRGQVYGGGTAQTPAKSSPPCSPNSPASFRTMLPPSE